MPKVLQPAGLPANTMGINMTPELMAMYLRGLQAQRETKKKKKIGLQSGIESNLLSKLRESELNGRTDEGALMKLRSRHPDLF